MSRHRRVDADAVIDPDQWESGLRFGMKTLNTKEVTRAKAPSEVLLICAQHNLRIDNEKHRHRSPPDPARKALNSVLRGADHPATVSELALNTFEELGINLAARRMDTIVGIEMVFQPPPGSDTPEFYDECLRWVGANFQHVISAAIHHDQKRPHMHVIVLAVVDGRLDGSGMFNGTNGWPYRKASFMEHVRDMLGLRPDRAPKKEKKAKTMASIFTGAGAGPKTHAAAARGDAELEQRAARAEAGNLIAHEPNSPQGADQPHSPAEFIAHDLMARDLILRRVRRTFNLFNSGIAAGVFSAVSATPIEPVPKPRAGGGPTRVRRPWKMPAGVSVGDASVPTPGTTGGAATRPVLTPPLEAAPATHAGDGPITRTLKPFVLPPHGEFPGPSADQQLPVGNSPPSLPPVTAKGRGVSSAASRPSREYTAPVDSALRLH